MREYLGRLRELLRDWLDLVDFTSVQKRSLAALGALALIVSIFFVSRGNSDPIATAPLAPIVIVPMKMTIDVAGGVEKPGVYSLPADSRVVDAITAAGGAKAGSDTSDINLARILKDGEQIYVEPPQVISRTAPAATKRVAKKSGPININRATAREFDSLPGIGPVLAARIVGYRKSNGPFAAIEDLQKVSGIGSSKFAELKSKIRV